MVVSTQPFFLKSTHPKDGPDYQQCLHNLEQPPLLHQYIKEAVLYKQNLPNILTIPPKA